MNQERLARRQERTVLMDEEHMRRALGRIAHEILESNQGTRDLFLVGIKSRGVPLAERLGRRLYETEGEEVPVGHLEVTPFRDDVSQERRWEAEPRDVGGGDLGPEALQGRVVVLVDDVLYTGRTARAALDALMEFGRPQRIKLAVLVDRGHRELPLRPDYVGKNVPTSQREFVAVRVVEIDGEDRVVLEEDIPAESPPDPEMS